MRELRFIQPLSGVGKEDLPTAGGKGANLGEMLRCGLPVPEGFVVLVDAYRKYVEANDLEKEIGRLLAGLETADQKEAGRTFERLKGLFMRGRSRRISRQSSIISMKSWVSRRWLSAHRLLPKICPGPPLPASIRPF